MDPRLNLEPGAIAFDINTNGDFYNDLTCVTPEQLSAWAQLSIAISLKRIADSANKGGDA